MESFCLIVTCGSPCVCETGGVTCRPIDIAACYLDRKTVFFAIFSVKYVNDFEEKPTENLSLLKSLF